MDSDRTPGKWSVWATHPRRLGAIAESYPTTVAAAARAADLRQAGYTVEVTLLPTDPDGPAGMARNS